MKLLKVIAIFIFVLLISAFLIFPANVQSEDIQKNIVENEIINFYKAPRVSLNNFEVRYEINESLSDINNTLILNFYNQFTGNWIISKTIIDNAIEYSVPIHIAFSIAWHESKFNPSAISTANRNGTRDWGLFQLNDSYRQNWTRSDFLNINLNSEEGLRHFKWGYDQVDDIILALKAYNAGMSRVINNSVPDSTNDYVNSILEYESFLDKEFNDAFGVLELRMDGI